MRLSSAFGAPLRASPDAESSKAFDKLFTQSDLKDVDRQTFDAQNFDAVTLCYLSAVAAGSTDGGGDSREPRRGWPRRDGVHLAGPPTGDRGAAER